MATSSPNTSLTPKTYTLRGDHQPMVGGVEISELVRRYGTPLYVLDEATIRTMAQAYKNALATGYTGKSLPLYAGKANLNLGMCKLIEQEGLGLDVVSGGELYTALHAGFPVENIFFNGNNKTLEELELALHNGVGRITVDNFYELEQIHLVASKMNKRANVLFRITPGIECHTHDYIKTGHIDSKFGFDLSTLYHGVELVLNQYQATINLKGFHAHIGSQIFETAPYRDLITVMFRLYQKIRDTYNNHIFEDLNLGGGLGVTYTPQDDPPEVPRTMSEIGHWIQAEAKQLNYPLPRLMVEPGRSMVATAGITLYTIGSTKEVPGIRKYVAIDGGMGDNIRPALYQAQYSAAVANKLDRPLEETVTIAGKFCESGDILIQELEVPKVEAGDILMVFGTGAYNYSMASNYNRMPRPAMVLVENGRSHLLVQRETFEDLMRQDLIPGHLQT